MRNKKIKGTILCIGMPDATCLTVSSLASPLYRMGYLMQHTYNKVDAWAYIKQNSKSIKAILLYSKLDEGSTFPYVGVIQLIGLWGDLCSIETRGFHLYNDTIKPLKIPTIIIPNPPIKGYPYMETNGITMNEKDILVYRKDFSVKTAITFIKKVA